MRTRIAAIAVAVLLAGGAAGETHRLEAASLDHLAAGPVKVTVNYTGKGTVDPSHRVWVWLFDTPDIGAGSMPIDQMSVEKNGEVAAFEVSGDRVWVAVAFDELGVMTGNEPPPSGTPIGIYMAATGAPQAVLPGAAGAVTVTFDDSQRMP